MTPDLPDLTDAELAKADPYQLTADQIDRLLAEVRRREEKQRIAALEAENARLRGAMSNLRVVVRQMPSHQIAMTVIAHVDSALAPQPAPEDDCCSVGGAVVRVKQEAKPSAFVPRAGDPNHDMTIGPCQCGAWHKEGDLP